MTWRDVAIFVLQGTVYVCLFELAKGTWRSVKKAWRSMKDLEK